MWTWRENKQESSDFQGLTKWSPNREMDSLAPPTHLLFFLSSSLLPLILSHSDRYSYIIRFLFSLPLSKSLSFLFESLSQNLSPHSTMFFHTLWTNIFRHLFSDIGRERTKVRNSNPKDFGTRNWPTQEHCRYFTPTQNGAQFNQGGEYKRLKSFMIPIPMFFTCSEEEFCCLLTSILSAIKSNFLFVFTRCFLFRLLCLLMNLK